MVKIDGAIHVPMEHFTSGVYFLCMDDEIVYVGQSVTIMSRLGGHAYYRESLERLPLLRDGVTPRPINGRMWNHAFYIKCEVEDLDDMERKYILELEPRLNGRRSNGTMMAPAGSQPAPAPPVKSVTWKPFKPMPAPPVKRIPRWGPVTDGQRAAMTRSIERRRMRKAGTHVN